MLDRLSDQFAKRCVQVDVDLSEEGNAMGVSRQHAKLELKRDGSFYLRNVGRKPVLVNDARVLQVRAVKP